MRNRYIVFVVILHLLSFNCFAGDWAKEILAESGVKGGLVVHIGCGDGRLTLDLRVNDSFVVHGLDRDAGKVERAREFIWSRGSYGPVSVSVLRDSRLPYADNLVNLVVSEDLGDISTEEVMRVLAPRGVALIKRKGKWARTVKPWPGDIDEWTHWLYDASGNAVSHDTVAGPPRHLQWTARPLWARYHNAPSSTSAMVSANGRIFYISDEGPAAVYENVADKWFLVARDGFNGVLLWKRALPKWGWKEWTANWHARNNQPFQLPKRLVAVGDRVFVTLGFNSPLTELDGATGEIVRTFEGTEYTDEILFHDGLLVLGLNNARHDPAAVFPEPIRKSIAVLNADSGRVLFRRGDYTGLNAKRDSMSPVGRLELAVGDGRMFIADHNDVVAVCLRSGEELWRTARLDGPRQKANFNTWMGDLCTLVYNKGVVLFAQPEGTLGFHSCPGTLYAFDARDGGLLWQSRYGGWVHNTQPNVFVINGLVWIHEYQETEMNGRAPVDTGALKYAVLGLDLRTGRQERRYDTRAIFDVDHHHRCYRNKATERFLLTSRRGVEFTDLASSEIDLNHWTRGDCHIGVMPSNGMLYTTPHPCDCHIATKLNGYFCLAPEQSADRRRASRQPLIKGPAYGKISNIKYKISNSESWPTFRANAMRSGSTKTPVGSDLKEKWKTDLGGVIGPATVDGGKVFVPVIDAHRVVALDAVTGDVAWSFTAGARVDTPPTIYKGMAIFGSADGWAYCVRASDGQLVWARRIAPDDRLIGKDGQLESAWPVHGSILISETGSKSGGAVAYMTAGRSSYLDGGIYFYALEPETGEVIEHHVEYSPDPETGKMPDGDAFDLPGMLADILVGDGSTVWMRRQVAFGEGSQGQGQTHIFATGGFRDDSWFNRTTWSAGDVSRARLLVFDDSLAYGVEVSAGKGRGKPFTPGTEGYSLFARPLKATKPIKRVAQKGAGAESVKGDGKGKGSGKGGGKEIAKDPGWSRFVAVRGMAMALAGEVLFVAGAPDTVDPADWLGAFEGRKGAVLMAVSAEDGGVLAEYELEKPPVFDGLVAAGGRLYVSTMDGNVVCFDGE